MKNQLLFNRSATAASKVLYKELTKKRDQLESEPICTQDPELWWQHDPQSIAEAKMFCHSCPLMDLCAAYSIEANEREGIWGGLDPNDRQAIRRREAYQRRAQREKQRARSEALARMFAEREAERLHVV